MTVSTAGPILSGSSLRTAFSVATSAVQNASTSGDTAAAEPSTARDAGTLPIACSAHVLAVTSAGSVPGSIT